MQNEPDPNPNRNPNRNNPNNLFYLIIVLGYNVRVGVVFHKLLNIFVRSPLTIGARTSGRNLSENDQRA